MTIREWRVILSDGDRVSTITCELEATATRIKQHAEKVGAWIDNRFVTDVQVTLEPPRP
jgi:hypothetical protein